jgi:hypothetical protein
MNSIEVTTRIGCPNECLCCPQAITAETYKDERKVFNLQDYCCCLDGVAGESMLFDFAGFTEPFSNPDCSKMIVETIRRGYRIRLVTTLVGTSVAQTQLLAAIEGIFLILIHVPDTKWFTLNADTWISIHKRFFNLGIPANYSYVTLGIVPDRLGDYLTGMGVEHIRMQTVRHRAGTDENSPARIGPTYCLQQRWHNNVLLPSGDVYLCCEDFSLKHRLGNLILQPYSEIYQAAQKLMLSDSTKLICNQCQLGDDGYWLNPFGLPS